MVLLFEIKAAEDDGEQAIISLLMPMNNIDFIKYSTKVDLIAYLCFLHVYWPSKR